VAADAGLPVNFHVGEAFGFEHRGGLTTAVFVGIAPFRKPFSELVFGGVFDRHPNLTVVFSEGGIAWVPPALQDAEMLYDIHGSGQLMEAIALRPTDYWRRNCYATFQNDLLGLRQLDHVGADRVMWAADYPHLEGSFGHGWSSRQSVSDATTPENTRKILGGTAAEVYNLHKSS
jgi:predicted TIM-barrel fold metal-dependent hydrolase